MFPDGQLLIVPLCFEYINDYGEDYGYKHPIHVYKYVLDYDTLTRDSCMDHCKQYGMKIFILEVGIKCKCSNTMPTSDIHPDSECNQPCSGEPGTEGKCGGSRRYNVYFVH